MKLRPLTPDETLAIRAMVEHQVDVYLRSSRPERPVVQGGIYTVVWEVLALESEILRRVQWTLGEVGFAVSSIIERTAPSEVPGVIDLFFAVEARRRTAFLPDCLFGEALALEAIACTWGASVHAFQLQQDHTSLTKTRQSLYGPMGSDIA